MSRLAVSLRLRRGEFVLDAALATELRGVVGVLGDSGAGKSTLLRCIGGLERARGEIRLGEETWQDDVRGVFVPSWKRRAAIVFQDARLFPHLDVGRNLRFAERRGGARADPARVIEALALGALLKRSVDGLSGGERQRVALGRAVLSDPRLLLLDEPLASVGDAHKREILPLIRTVADEFGVPALFVSHSIPELIEVCDQMVVMNAGRVALHGAVNDVLANLHDYAYAGDQTGIVLSTRVVAHDEAHHLTVVEFNGQTLFVPQRNAAVGAPLRVHLLSRNVSVATERVGTGFSVLNVLEGRVCEIRDVARQPGVVDLVIDVGAPLVATVTRKSSHGMGIQVGQRVFAYAKAVAL
jgi:molybdate transport system ATP-binding protein